MPHGTPLSHDFLPPIRVTLLVEPVTHKKPYGRVELLTLRAEVAKLQCPIVENF